MSSGAPDNPIRIEAYNGKKVIMMGTEKISGKWLAYDEKVMKLPVNKKYHQVFVGTTLMKPARWPNLDHPERIADYFENNKRAVIHEARSSNGMIYPEDFPSHLDCEHPCDRKECSFAFGASIKTRCAFDRRCGW